MTMSSLFNEISKRITRVGLASPLICGWLFLLPHPALCQSKPYVTLDQGPAWTESAGREFYIRDLGSRILPLSWMVALKQSNGHPFLEGNLGRYGYLENEFAEKAGLPVGFPLSSTGYENFLGGSEVVGMTCAACHTRQISVNDKVYRIDGAPGIVDLQSFLADLDKAVGMVLANNARFADFAKIVLGNPAPADQVAK